MSLQTASRTLIKIGTNVMSQDDGTLDEVVLKELVRQISILKKSGHEVILVTSGAVGSGRSLLCGPHGCLRLVHGHETDRQIFAAVGQIKLMNLYSKFFAETGDLCAQVLITKEDLRDRLHYLNIKNCFEGLLKEKIVPVVNENDVVSVTELMFTDNDELSGLIAGMLDVQTVVILSNVDGIFDRNPKLPDAKIIREIHPQDSLEKYIAPDRSSFGRGGMLTKSRIGQKLAKLGITTHIANGKRENILIDILQKNQAVSTEPVAAKTASFTTFLPQKKQSSLKRWIAYSRGYEKGVAIINKCAEDVIASHQKAVSLLPVGVVGIEGDFEKGEIIKVRNEAGRDIGYGRAEYSSKKARELLGQKDQKPLIHYDHLFLDL